MFRPTRAQRLLGIAACVAASFSACTKVRPETGQSANAPAETKNTKTVAPGWLGALEKAGLAQPALPPVIAAAVAKAVQMRGIPDESAAPFIHGPCSVSLRSGNITCDFGAFVYDSAGLVKIAVKGPITLADAGDGHLLVVNEHGPQRFLQKIAEGSFHAINPAGGIRDVRKNPDGGFTGFFDGYGTDVSVTFDAGRRLVTEVDPGSRVLTQHTYDGKGRWTGSRAPGITVQVAADEAGKPTSISIGESTLNFQYTDDAIKATLGQAPYATLMREGAGSELIGSIEYGGKTYRLTYEAGRIKSFEERDGLSFAFTWTGDQAAQTAVVKETRSGNVVFQARFEGPWRVETVSTNGIERIKRDAYGRSISREDAAGRVEHFVYDDAGRVVTVAGTSTSGAVKPLRSLTYNAFGQVLEVVAPASRARFEYDTAGRLIAESEESLDRQRHKEIKKFDDAGRPVKIEETVVANASSELELTYDAQGRVTKKEERTVTGRSTATADLAADSISTDTVDLFGERQTYKKTVNRADGSTVEVKTVKDALGREQSVSVVSGAAGSERVEKNEIGLIESKAVDAQGQITKFASALTKHPLMGWVADAVIAAENAKRPRPAASNAVEASLPGKQVKSPQEIPAALPGPVETLNAH